MNKFTFDPSRSPKERLGQVKEITKYLTEMVTNATKPFVVEFKDFVETKSDRQLKGFFRICGILAPYLQESEGVLFDKDLVAAFVADECNYVTLTKGKRLRKSFKKATVKDMKALIDRLYEIGACFEAVGYELTSYEKQAMNEFYKLTEK